MTGGEWHTQGMPKEKEKGDYLCTIFDDSAMENIVISCWWGDRRGVYGFWYEAEDIKDYVIAWMKYPAAYDKTHNPILSKGKDAWVSQHL